MAVNGTGRVRTLIVDDEELGRRMLRSQLSTEDVEIVGEASTAPEARRKILELRPDLVFLDIELPGGSGMDVVRDLGEPVPYIVFVTAHAEFAVPAFELQADDYIVKPVQGPRILGSVYRARKRLAERRAAKLAMQLVGALGETAPVNGEDLNAAALEPQARYSNQVKIRVRRRMFALDVSEISWIQGASQYCRVHTRRGEFLLARTLASMECELDPSRFFRIHRSAIINAAHVREVRTTGDGRYNIYLHGGQALPLGRARREVLERLLSGIAGRNGAP